MVACGVGLRCVGQGADRTACYVVSFYRLENRLL